MSLKQSFVTAQAGEESETVWSTIQNRASSVKNIDI